MPDFTMTVDAEFVAIIRFDAIGRTMNTLTAAGWDELATLVARIAAEPAIRGAAIVSGKTNGFCAGADLDEMIEYAGVASASPAARQAAYDGLFRANRVARAIETCGKPFAAVIDGLALGGGFELALACHHRVATDDPSLRLGLPEATIGLLPGGGGTQRVARLLGVARALPLLTGGKPVAPRDALALGLVDALTPTGGELAAARRWILAQGDPVAPWDRPGFVLPGGVDGIEIVDAVAKVAATWGSHYTAQTNIVRAVREGVRVPMDAAIELETHYFVDTLQTPQAKAMIRTLFGSHPALRKGAARPASGERRAVRRVGVLGAGMMGAGIGYALASAGIDSVLVDVSLAVAEKGKDYARGAVDRQVARGLIARGTAEAILARITPTSDYAAVSSVEVLIETVFEDVAVKAEATGKALAHAGADILFASNTSTLPIGRLAQAHPRPENFLGMHFHSPVDRMELVEVVRGAATGEGALARAVELVRQMGKTAIIANDSPFFYTSRVFDTYIREGMEMLVDGFAPDTIDRIGRLTGMPRGPLELTDDVAIDLVDRIAGQRRLLLGAEAERRRSDDVVDMLVAAGRFGRKNGKGFYDYTDGTKRVWDGLAATWPVRTPEVTSELSDELQRRFLHRQAVEAARCLAEGVLKDPRHADVGAILGWNFPRWTGGPVSYIEQVGVARFVTECDALSLRWGDRFLPPEALRRMAASGNIFYPALSLRRAAA
ncbi:3-hydroxyacyl-CoA dehydrogenase NAD-binding domain-containing protein [Sphingomonas bacterium]|uniref:3-hydroxyacyl-CoA dehydrogenase NAD-binding domain-containing protein n=1 Tax=Sphingomonas bacterium TaxID=1895847 RepID=UPI00157650A1|nr:3-hydroxyacyl-CoA dehydrogenase NAD-binding domain-containing protein [Sphingomonas bacterium]